MQLSTTLDEILTNIWHLLFRGAVQKKDPLHTATIGTIKKGIPQLRTVVLRKTDTTHRQLYFYTDIRSEKVQQLKENPTLSWLFYHPKKNVQIRALGKAKIFHQDELTKRHWQTLPWYGRKTYGTIQSPSSTLQESSDDLPDLWRKTEVDIAETAYAYQNFVVIVCEITELEWLHLDRSGHQRAHFSYLDDDWKGSWIVP